MKQALLRWNAVLAGLCVTAGLAGCVSAPQGPRVAIMPAPGKPLDLFAAEDQYCRDYARQSLGPDTRGQAAVGSAVLGTLLGAAIGSATSTRRYNNTAAGAATGLLMGTAIGAGNSADEGRSAQQRYDIAYSQCMATGPCAGGAGLSAGFVSTATTRVTATATAGNATPAAAIATAIATAVGRVRCRAAQVGWLVVRRVRAPFALRAVGGPV